MPEYLAPGVFIEEIGVRSKPIEGVATDTTALLGETERGPMQPRLVTGYDQYLRLYGDVFADGKYMPLGVKAFFDNGGRRCYIVRVVGEGALPAVLEVEGLRIQAIGPGRWGNRVFVRITQAGDASGSPGFRLQVAYYGDEATAGLFDPFDESNRDRGLSEPESIEDFVDLSLDPGSENHWRRRIADSALITLEIPDGTTAWPPRADDVLGGWLSRGLDGAVPGALQFQGQVDDTGNAIKDPEQLRGLAVLDLEPYDDVAIVHAPGIGNTDEATTAIQRAIVTHCEHNGFRFAILDAAPDLSADSDNRLDPRRTLDTQYGAFYYPWYYTPHPRDGTKTLVPPGGAVCGIYAQTDSRRGVWKAPANVVVTGAIDLEHEIDKARHELLNPRGVNCIRRLRGRGIR
ncbi:MAG: phage tail sheath subtilisin-like domain-containing protein, partial [Chromatiales bacterium]